MKISVYDTYVKKNDGQLMHFDVFLPKQDLELALTYARKWLNEIGLEDVTITAEECRFCHQEIANPMVASAIQEQGYYIYEMEGCPQAS